MAKQRGGGIGEGVEAAAEQTFSKKACIDFWIYAFPLVTSRNTTPQQWVAHKRGRSVARGGNGNGNGRKSNMLAVLLMAHATRQIYLNLFNVCTFFTLSIRVEFFSAFSFLHFFFNIYKYVCHMPAIYVNRYARRLCLFVLFCSYACD